MMEDLRIGLKFRRSINQSNTNTKSLNDMEIQISHDTLKRKLSQGEFSFIFEKSDGSTRIACGTTSSELIPSEKLPKGGKSSSSGVSYYDLDVKDWRSIAKDKKVTVSYDQMLFVGAPHLEEEEIILMLWNHNLLEDKWLCRLIELIVDASVIDAVELSQGSFKKLIRVIKKYITESEYEEDLNFKWIKLMGE